MLAGQALDIQILKEVNAKSMLFQRKFTPAFNRDRSLLKIGTGSFSPDSYTRNEELEYSISARALQSYYNSAAA